MTKSTLHPDSFSPSTEEPLRELVAHLRQNRTMLGEEWASRVTGAKLLTARAPSFSLSFRGRSKMAIQVVVADDHQLVRQGLKVLLEREGFKVLGEASNGQEALHLAETLHPQVAVLDLAMPVLNGIDAAREIHRVSPRTKTVLLTMHTDRQYILMGLP